MPHLTTLLLTFAAGGTLVGLAAVTGIILDRIANCRARREGGAA